MTDMALSSSSGWYYNNTTWRGYWDASGNLQNTGNLTAYASDKRLKYNIKPIQEALYKLNQISGVTFDWDLKECNRWGFNPPSNDVGVIAQEVQAVLPQVVKYAPFDRDPIKGEGSNSGKDYLTVQYEKLVPLLIESIKELDNKVQTLKTRLNDVSKK
jgi:hypothetical protein